MKDSNGNSRGFDFVNFQIPYDAKKALVAMNGVIACIGDGSFQVIGQGMSMLRCGQKTIIFLINDVGYTIEVEIHDGL